MKKNYVVLFIIFLSLVMLSISWTEPRSSAKSIEGGIDVDKDWLPTAGVIPDSTTASLVSRAILLSVYGDDIKEQMPFDIELQGDSVWVLNGTFKEVQIGGTAHIEILKSNGKVLNITHGE